MRIYNIQNFISQLESEGRSKGTIEKYQRDVRAFAAWLDDLALEEASAWREYLLEREGMRR
jgi:site-specific recombinase XerD